MLTPIKAIRAKCLDCSNDSFKEVERCPIERCPLYPYRFGKNPNTKHVMTPARQAAIEKALLARGITTQAITESANPTAEGKDTTPDNSPEEVQPGQ